MERIERHNRQSRSELGLGLQTLTARALNGAKNFLLLTLVVGLPIYGGLCWGLLHVHSTEADRYVIKKWLEAWWMVEGLRWDSFRLTYLADDGPRLVEALQLYTWPYAVDTVRRVWMAMQNGLVGNGLGALFVVTLVAEAIHRRGRRLRGDHLLRGGQRVDAKALAKEVKRRKLGSKLHLAEVPLPAGSEVQHLALLGTPGTGKTVLLHSLIDDIGRSAPLIIYDTKGDLLAVHGELTRDTLLNPLDARCPRWTPWDEIESPADAWLIAEAWLAMPTQVSDPYWIKAARQLFVDILLCTPPAARSNGELCRLCVRASNDELKRLLAGTVSGRLFAEDGAERMRESVRNTLATDLRALSFLDQETRPGEGFSMRGWLREAVKAGDGRRIFLCCPPEQAAAITPLIAVMIESAAASLLALGTDARRRVGFVVDEFPTLPPLHYLQRLMVEGRAYGAMVMLAAQAFAQIRKTYGADAAETIASTCSTQVVFRVNDADSAERASKLLGDAEYDESRESDAHGKGGLGLNLSSQRNLRRLVLASEILALPDLQCFVKLSGGWPVTQIKLKPRQRRRQTSPYEPRLQLPVVVPAVINPPPAADEPDDRGLL